VPARIPTPSPPPPGPIQDPTPASGNASRNPTTPTAPAATVELSGEFEDSSFKFEGSSVCRPGAPHPARPPIRRVRARSLQSRDGNWHLETENSPRLVCQGIAKSTPSRSNASLSFQNGRDGRTPSPSPQTPPNACSASSLRHPEFDSRRRSSDGDNIGGTKKQSRDWVGVVVGVTGRRTIRKRPTSTRGSDVTRFGCHPRSIVQTRFTD